MQKSDIRALPSSEERENTSLCTTFYGELFHSISSYPTLSSGTPRGQSSATWFSGDLDEIEHYLLAGMQGATELGSEKRRQEVIANWHAAQNRWPQEKRVIALAESIHLQ